MDAERSSHAESAEPRQWHLEAPLDEATVRALRVNDVVYLSGPAVQMRGPACARALEYLGGERELPFSARDGILYHAYSATEFREGRWQLHYVGPTLSFRMDKFLAGLLRGVGFRTVIGKAGGGLSAATAQVMRELGCVHLVQIGGTPAYHRSRIDDRIHIFWEDLETERGVEYLFREFGPLVVSVDTEGGTLFREGSYVPQELYKGGGH